MRGKEAISMAAKSKRKVEVEEIDDELEDEEEEEEEDEEEEDDEVPAPKKKAATKKKTKKVAAKVMVSTQDVADALSTPEKTINGRELRVLLRQKGIDKIAKNENNRYEWPTIEKVLESMGFEDLDEARDALVESRAERLKDLKEKVTKAKVKKRAARKKAKEAEPVDEDEDELEDLEEEEDEEEEAPPPKRKAKTTARRTRK